MKVGVAVGERVGWLPEQVLECVRQGGRGAVLKGRVIK
jgi:hypothetical protein